MEINSSHHNEYRQYKQKQQRLANMLNHGAHILESLNMGNHANNLKTLCKKVHKDSFKIQVVGTFKNGKSTFINSFLGEEILPAYALPCTAVINEVKYGEEKKAVLHFKNPLPPVIPNELSEISKRHIKRYEGKKIPPLLIPYDEIEDYVVIPMGKDPKEMLLESPYEKVELFWPLEILKNGVEIIDSPGLNEHATRTKVTVDYLTKADAILFVLSATALCSKEEMSFVDNVLKPQGFEDLFFVVNRFDMIPQNEKKSIVDYARAKLTERTSFGKNGIYFVSARDALDGKIDSNAELLKQSGMEIFEKVLSRYLTGHKGKIKLMQPTKELKRIIHVEALGKVIPSQREMMRTSLESLKEEYRIILPRIEDIRQKRQKLSDRIINKIEASREDILLSVEQSTAALVREVPKSIEGYELKTKLGAFPSKEKASAASMEIINHVQESLEVFLAKWLTEEFRPMIQEFSGDIFESAELQLTELLKNIDTVNKDFMSVSSSRKEIPTLERIYTDIGGFEFTENTKAIAVKITGLTNDLTRTICMKVSSGISLNALSSMNPVKLVTYVIQNIADLISVGDSRIVAGLKNDICSNIVSVLKENAATQADSAADTAVNDLKKVADKMFEAVDIEIGELESQIKTMIAEMEKGTSGIEEKNRLINECEQKLTDLCKATDAFAYKLINP